MLRYLPVLAVLLVTTSARADRAVGPIDRLSPWTVELGGAASYGDDTEVVVAPWMRVWLSDVVEVGLRQPISGSASGDVELSSSLVADRGALAGGASLALVLPTGGWTFSSERIAVSAAALGAWRAFSGGHLYARPSYTARAGDYPLDAADAASLEIGLAVRARALSLVPRIAAERTLDLAGAIDAFTTWRAAIEAAVELAPDLTTSARLDWAAAGAHHLDDGNQVGETSEVVATLGLAWAWDLAPAQRAAPSRAADPAAIRLTDARIGARPAPAARLRELRQLVPRLRLATLDAERAAGGVRGEMVVRSSRHRVEVDDRVGAPALARAVAEFYRRSLPGWARTADRVEITLCFDRCADAQL